MTDDVSRGTPPAPNSARGAFGVRLALAERYVGWLAGPGTVRGLIGPREVDRLWERHVVNGALLGEVVPSGAEVCDVGSGAGLPGLPLAIARPDVRVTLVEPLLRRTTFLEEVVADLELGDRVEVLRSRAEGLHGVRRFGVVTSRAVAPLDRLLRWSMPLVAPEGVLLAVKGERAEGEIEETRSVWREELGCTEPEVLEISESSDGPQLRVVRVAWSDPARVSWPLARSGPGSGSARTRERKRRRSR